MAQNENSQLWDSLAAWFVAKHSEDQQKIADKVRDGVIRAFPALDFHNLDATQVPWVEATMPAVRAGYEQSQEATAKFLDTYRQIRLDQTGVKEPPRDKVVTEGTAARGAIPEGEVRQVAEPFNEPRTAARLLSTGPARVKKAMPAPKSDAMAKGLKGAVGSAIQGAMEGGRGLAKAEAEKDRAVTAFQRITDADPCYFCALLAANGPVETRTIYKDNKAWNVNRKTGERFAPNAAYEATGDPHNIAMAHDHCCCTLVPVYNGKFVVHQVALDAAEMWNQSYSKGRSLREAMKEYRRLYEANGKAKEEPINASELRSALVKSGDAQLRSWASAL